MTEIQIEYFLKVAEHQSMSEAAAEMYVSQAAVSRQISSLEEEFDLKLFERKYRGLILTSAGEIMYDYFSKQRAELAHALKEAKKHQGAESLTLNIGLIEGIDMDEIYMSILNFAKQNPNHNINITIADITTLIEGISSGEFDMVFSFHQETLDNKYLKAIPAINARFQFFMAQSHPLAASEKIELDDLANETFAAPVTNADNVLKYYKNRFISICGFAPKKLICKNNLDSVMAEVRYNNCIAMLYDITLVAQKEKFRIIDTNVYNHISLLYLRSNDNPLLARLIRHLYPLLLG